jgi:Holliday junction resolvase RusA-like endonuclease
MSTCKPVEFTIYGEPASKANSRQIVTIRGRPAVIKSKKARAYVKTFEAQCPKLSPLLDGDLTASIKIFYRTRRPDLDASVVLDCMQGLVIENDRQFKELHLYHGLSKENPRAEISITKKPPNKKKGG